MVDALSISAYFHETSAWHGSDFGVQQILHSVRGLIKMSSNKNQYSSINVQCHHEIKLLLIATSQCLYIVLVVAIRA